MNPKETYETYFEHTWSLVPANFSGAVHLLRIFKKLIFARPKKMHEPRTVCSVNNTLSA